MTNSSTQNKTHIKVIDSPLGSGKTSWSIQYINQLPSDKPILYITPFIDEVERIIEKCKDYHFIQPNISSGRGNKMNHLINLINAGRNIASTHALFLNIGDKLIEALKLQNYVLILDEALSVVEKFDLFKEKKYDDIETHYEMTVADLDTLFGNNFIYADPDNYTVQWIGAELKKYEELKRLADRKLLYYVNDSVLLWSFPTEVFKEGIFSEVYILTFQFDYQFQSLYYNYFDIQYSLYHIVETEGVYNIIPTENKDYELEWKSKIKELIHIWENDKANEIGSASSHINKYSLSKGWYKSNQDSWGQLYSNTRNFFQHITKKSSGSKKMWTCFVSYKSNIKGDKVTARNFEPLNSRATNKLAHKTSLAYLVNRFPDPFFEHFFSKRGIKVDEDGFALSEMLQWIFRSAIRNNQPIEIYIPSERMRTLLKKWLNNEPVKF